MSDFTKQSKCTLVMSCKVLHCWFRHYCGQVNLVTGCDNCCFVSLPQVDGLTRELQVMGELYHQQREEALTLVSQGCKQQEWMVLCSALRSEKEGMGGTELWSRQVGLAFVN